MKTKLAVTALKGVGPKIEKILHRLGIDTIEDLLHYYPRDYEAYQPPITIQAVTLDEINVIEAAICRPIEHIRKNKLHILKTKVRDTTGEIVVTWFNQPYIKNKLKQGETYVFIGKAEYKYGQLQILSPEVIIKEEYEARTKVLQPIYPLTQGLTQKSIRNFINQSLEATHHQLIDYLEEKTRLELHLAEYNYATEQIHFPETREALRCARERLVFDEFLFFQLALLQLKGQKEVAKNGFQLKSIEEVESLIDNLPFELTTAQKRVWEDITKDLSKEHVMNRLIQGDVGSGKTILAALALFYVCKNGYQGSLMAPTEVLAKQHYETLSALLSPYGIQVGILVGSMTSKEKREMIAAIENQEVQLIIGTHALIQEKVVFKQLALVITDEQHRFGVKQRELLAKKGSHPHVLVMSATPIPRTLALIVYGDLDVSVVDELPPGRQTIETYAVNSHYRQRIYDFIKKETAKGRQTYIICPMVEASENMEAESVIEYTDKIREALPSEIKIDYLHGKMKPKEKDEVMTAFATNQIQVLVSTTVVEVGVNVPNATLMIIENADRFGLSQLHQLRGRVGRGQHQSYCILLSDAKSKKTKERLQVLCQSNDGFYISEQDLKLRGPGDMFGIRQHGIAEFKLGNIFHDFKWLQIAHQMAKEIIANDPALVKDKHKLLKEKLNAYFEMNARNIGL